MFAAVVDAAADGFPDIVKLGVIAPTVRSGRRFMPNSPWKVLEGISKMVSLLQK